MIKFIPLLLIVSCFSGFGAGIVSGTISANPNGGGSGGTNNYTAGSGISIAGSTIAVDGSVLRTNNISNITNIVDTSSFGYGAYITNNTGSNLWISLNVSLYPGPNSSLLLIINNTANGGGIVTNTVSMVTNNAYMMLSGFVGPSGYYGLIGGANSAVTSWQRIYSPLAQSISITGGGSGTTYTNNPAIDGAGVISGSGIGTTLSSAQLASAGVVTTNTGAVSEKWVQLFFSDIDTSALYMYWCDPPATNGSFTVIGTNSIWLEPNGKAIRDPAHIKYNGTYYLAYNVGVTNVGVGIATSADDRNWQFRGYLSYNPWMHWSPKWFIDATNGLWLQVRVVLNTVYEQPQSIIALKPDISNPTNFTGVTMYLTNAWGAGDVPTAQTVYWNNLYYAVNSDGKIWNNTMVSSNGWNLVADGSQFLTANGPCLNRWNGNWYFNDSEDSGGLFWYESSDLTNWVNVADFTGAVQPPIYNVFPEGSVHEGTAISEFYANPMPSSLGVYAGKFTGNGSGLTNLNLTTATGTLPLASVPWHIQNIFSTGSQNVGLIAGENYFIIGCGGPTAPAAAPAFYRSGANWTGASISNIVLSISRASDYDYTTNPMTFYWKTNGVKMGSVVGVFTNYFTANGMQFTNSSGLDFFPAGLTSVVFVISNTIANPNVKLSADMLTRP